MGKQKKTISPIGKVSEQGGAVSAMEASVQENYPRTGNFPPYGEGTNINI